MKKIGLALVALLALSLTFISCDGAGMEVLEASDITADWVEKGTWSGTETISSEASAENLAAAQLETGDIEWNSRKITVSELKNIIALDGTSADFIFAKMAYGTCVKANKARTKLYIEQTIDYDILGAKFSATDVINLEKD